jgi:hypothetical protein
MHDAYKSDATNWIVPHAILPTMVTSQTIEHDTASRVVSATGHESYNVTENRWVTSLKRQSPIVQPAIFLAYAKRHIMTDDVPAQITLYPGSTDIETSHWGFLAPTLWHAGLIWRDYEMVVFDLTPIELRIWCTFTDRGAFESWRHHELVIERCAEILASKIDVFETVTPWARHDKRCDCDQTTEFVLRGHGFGNRKSVLVCCDCLGYIPNYRVLELAEDCYTQLQLWAIVYGHVYDIWMLTAGLEDWALNELQSPVSETNSSGRELALLLENQLKKRVWYDHFTHTDERGNSCPSCDRPCGPAKWSTKKLACSECQIVY